MLLLSTFFIHLIVVNKSDKMEDFALMMRHEDGSKIASAEQMEIG